MVEVIAAVCDGHHGQEHGGCSQDCGGGMVKAVMVKCSGGCRHGGAVVWWWWLSLCHSCAVVVVCMRGW